MNSIDKNSSIYFNLSGTLLAPNENRGSIISVFNQKIKRYITRENLCEMMTQKRLSPASRDIQNIARRMAGERVALKLR